MKQNDLELKLITVQVEKGKLEDALWELSTYDDDFNGSNGPEYLWDDLDPDVFDSNAEYLITVLTGSEVNIVREFIKQWMESNSRYYTYEYEILADEAGKVEYISLAIILKE